MPACEVAVQGAAGPGLPFGIGIGIGFGQNQDIGIGTTLKMTSGPFLGTTFGPCMRMNPDPAVATRLGTMLGMLRELLLGPSNGTAFGPELGPESCMTAVPVFTSVSGTMADTLLKTPLNPTDWTVDTSRFIHLSKVKI